MAAGGAPKCSVGAVVVEQRNRGAEVVDDIAQCSLAGAKWRSDEAGAKVPTRMARLELAAMARSPAGDAGGLGAEPDLVGANE